MLRSLWIWLLFVVSYAKRLCTTRSIIITCLEHCLFPRLQRGAFINSKFSTLPFWCYNNNATKYTYNGIAFAYSIPSYTAGIVRSFLPVFGWNTSPYFVQHLSPHLYTTSPLCYKRIGHISSVNPQTNNHRSIALFTYTAVIFCILLQWPELKLQLNFPYYYFEQITVIISARNK